MEIHFTQFTPVSALFKTILNIIMNYLKIYTHIMRLILDLLGWMMQNMLDLIKCFHGCP